MAVAVDCIVAILYTRHVIHARSPATAPICTVTPSTVQLQPFVICRQYREHLVQTVIISELGIIKPFRPRQQVRARTGGIISAETIGTICPYFAADEAVGVLFSVEIIKSFLEREEVFTVTAEHGNKGIVPHEDVSVVCRSNITGNETGVVERLTDVSDAYLPRSPVHLNLLRMPFPIGRGQHLAGLFECSGLCLFYFRRTKRVLCNERFHNISVFVRQFI